MVSKTWQIEKWVGSNNEKSVAHVKHDYTSRITLSRD